MANNDSLNELADIHVPQEPGIWPPAPGWWVVGAIAAGLLAWAGVIAYRRWQVQRRCQFALAELDRCLARDRADDGGQTADPEQRRLDAINEMNAVLRRVALRHFPRSQVASLSGRDWVRFLQDHGDASLMDQAQSDALAQGRFARHCDVQPEALHRTARRWIRSLYWTRIGNNETTSTTMAGDHA